MTTSPAAPGAGAAAGEDGELTHRQILTILAGLMSAMFLASLDQTIVSTSIRTIADDLHGLDAQAWVTTAYLMTSTISTPIYGKLSDIYGRKPFFLVGIVIFVLGSLACSMATSMYMLAAFRGIQGLGAGALMSLALAIIGDVIPPRDRAKYQGYMLAVFGTSSVLGPVIGGFLADLDSLLGVTGWRWVFLINVFIGAVALVMVTVTLKVHNERVDHRIDWAGAAAIIMGVAPLLLVAEQGREWGWTSTSSIVCFVLGAVGIAAFVLAERRAGDEALIPLRLFGDRAFSITTVGGVIVGMAMFGGMMTLPLYMQIVHGASPMQSGLMMLPMVLGMMGASIASGQMISRTGRVREFPIVGALLMAGAMFLLSTIDADTHLWLVMVYMLLLGIGLGNCMQPLTLIVQNAVNPREIGVATSSATFFRQLGGTMGVAVFLSILFSTVGGKIKDQIATATADGSFAAGIRAGLADPALRTDDPQAYEVVKGLADPATGAQAMAGLTKDSSVIDRLPELVAHPFQQGFALAMDSIFLAAGCLGLLAAVVLMFLPPIELRTGSARAAAARDAAEAGV